MYPALSAIVIYRADKMVVYESVRQYLNLHSVETVIVAVNDRVCDAFERAAAEGVFGVPRGIICKPGKEHFYFFHVIQNSKY